jgi:hypothetical protein
MKTSPQNSPVSEKEWWQSRTIIGVIVMILAQVLKALNVDLVSQELTDIVTLAMETVGASMAIYGRINARKAITVPGGKFNPRAEVRKPKGYKFPKTGGCVHTSGAVAGLILMLFLLGLVGLIGSCESRASREEMSWEEMMWRRDAMLESQVLPAITFEEFVDRRPFFVRLLDSVRVGLTGNVATNGVPEVLITGGADF